MYLYSGKKLKGTTNINGVNYPLSFLDTLSDSDLAILGVSKVADPAIPDSDLYTWIENDDGSLTVTPRPAADIFNIKKNQLENAVQNMLDKKAQEHGYDGILSACSYTGAANPFQIESQTFVAWRGNVWATCYSLMAEVIAGSRAIPTVDELIASLPVYTP